MNPQPSTSTKLLQDQRECELGLISLEHPGSAPTSARGNLPNTDMGNLLVCAKASEDIFLLIPVPEIIIEIQLLLSAVPHGHELRCLCRIFLYRCTELHTWIDLS